MTDAAPTFRAQAAPTLSAGRLVPLSPAERMARSRARRKKGLVYVALELRSSEVDALIARTRLKPEERASRAAIANAVYSVLDDFVAASVPFRATVPPAKGVSNPSA